MYNLVKRFFDKGLYSNDNVKTFVRAGKITADQYQEITGEVFAA